MCKYHCTVIVHIIVQIDNIFVSTYNIVQFNAGRGDTILFFFRGYVGVCKVATQKSLSKSKRCWDTRAHTKLTWECVGYCRLRKYSIKVRCSQTEKSNEKTAKRDVAIFYNGNNSGRSPAKISEKKSPATSVVNLKEDREASEDQNNVVRGSSSFVCFSQLYAAAQASDIFPYHTQTWRQ